MDANIDKDNMRVCGALCCTYELLYCTFPQCLGCMTQGECLCLGQDCCCEPFDPNVKLLWCTPSNESICCQLGCGFCSCYLKKPTTCVKVTQHILCCFESISFPCESDMPCMFSVCGLMIYPKCGCCVKFADVKPQLKTVPN
ncbi:hypothetical protein EON65_08055 [archaeon]|nr:MAG: hypothetical protein EON65_08055 [archaeon]